MGMGREEGEGERMYKELVWKGYEVGEKSYLVKEWEKGYGYFGDKLGKFGESGGE